MNLLIQFFKFILCYSLLFGCGVVSRISNKRKCVDTSCSKPISLATSLLPYAADDDRLLSFPRNAKAKIFSKEAGDKPSLWEAEINGKRGYVPKGFFKEMRLLVKNSDVNIIVSTGRDDGKQNSTENKIENNKILTSTTTETPALPLANSKGLFGMIGGVSADSVPPNSPEISPQTTGKYQVLDGTTVYDDPASEILDKSPDIVSEVKQTPPIVKAASLNEAPIDSSKVKAPFESISSLNYNVKPDVPKGKKEVQQKNQVPSTESAKTTEKASNDGFNVDTVSNGNVTLDSTGTIIDNPHVSGENSIKSKSSEYLSENKKNYNQPSNNFGQETTEKIKQNTQTTEEAVITQDEANKITNENLQSENQASLFEQDTQTTEADGNTQAEPNEITNENLQSENRASMFDNFVNKVSHFISSGTGAEEEDEAEEEEEISVSDEDSGSGDNEESSATEENIHHKLLPENNVQEKFTHEKSQILEATSEAPALRDVVKPTFSPAVETASSIPADKPEEEARNSGISDSEDEKYLSGENFQEFPPRVENIEESALEVNGTTVFEDNTSNELKEEKPAIEEPKLIAVPVETDSPEIPVLSNNRTSENIEQSPIMETKTSKPVDILHTTQPILTELSLEKEDKVEEVPEVSSSIDNSKVFFANKNEDMAAGSVEPEITGKSVDENTTERFIGIYPIENLVESKHEELATQFSSKEEKETIAGQDSSHKTLEPAIVHSEQLKHTNEENTLSENKVEMEFNAPELDQIPSAPSTPSPIHNILSFQHSSHLPPTYSPVVDDSMVIPETDETSKEIEDSFENSYNYSSVTESDLTTQTQSEEYVDVVTLNPIIDDPPSEKLEDEAKLVEVSSTLLEEVYPDLNQEKSSEGIFSWLNPVFDMFSSSQLQSQEAEQVPALSDDLSHMSEHLDPFHISKLKEESCLANGLGEEGCEALKNVPSEAPQDDYKFTSLYSTDISSALELLEKIPLETTVWLIITAVVVLIFSLGHYYIEAHRRDGPLVAIINKLEREVLILRKESSILDDRLHTAQEQLEAWNTSSSENDALIVELKEELEIIRGEKVELEEQLDVLQREVESVTESGLEMHRLLSESLSSQDGSQVLLSTVESLREKLEHQEDEIASLSQSLYQKDVELEELKEKLEKEKEVSLELEQKVVDMVRQKDEEALQLKEQHRQLIAQLEEVMETKALDETRVSLEMSKLRLTLKELQKSLAEKESELEEVKEVVKQLRSTDSNEKMDALFDVVGVRAQLKQATTDRDTFREKFHEEEGARKLLEGHMKKITQEVSELKNSFETAEKEKIEALTKLQVLSNYFKEKESQLQKELGCQESMWLHKQSEDHTIYEQMRSLREENEKFKVENTTVVTVAPPQPKPRLAEVKTKKKSNSKTSSVRQTQGLQNESLKKEIVEQEASFKIQVANVEQKAHENWVTSRQAERRLKEVQQEAAQLRNRLTMEKSNFSLDDSKQNLSETNGDPSSPPPSLMFPSTTSPPFMMYPHMAPPGDFIPPPPLTGSPYPSDSRPPPLGRISSPPLDHRFSPPPPLPYPPYDYPHYGHHSPSPPPPLPPQSHHRNVHKPQPREMSREQKDHSNYAPETDKPTRRNKR